MSPLVGVLSRGNLGNPGLRMWNLIYALEGFVDGIARDFGLVIVNS